MEEHVANAHKITNHLSEDDQTQLAALLQRFLLSIEPQTDYELQEKNLGV